MIGQVVAAHVDTEVSSRHLYTVAKGHVLGVVVLIRGQRPAEAVVSLGEVVCLKIKEGAR